MTITSWIKQKISSQREEEPAPAYDRWAAGYDHQPGNLMLDLDRQLFSSLLSLAQVQGTTIVDIGCGTGRHWPEIYSNNPGKLVGYDVSKGMLGKLTEKFPSAETYQLVNEQLPNLADNSCGLLVSTLTVAHIPSLQKAMKEWNRILQPGAGIIITDYHPVALARGGKRTFKADGKTIAVKNHIYQVHDILEWASRLGWKPVSFQEKLINDSVRHYYEEQNALEIFEKYRNTPIIYGIYFRKS